MCLPILILPLFNLDYLVRKNQAFCHGCCVLIVECQFDVLFGRAATCALSLDTVKGEICKCLYQFLN